MKRYRLDTRAYHNGRIHEVGEIIELPDDCAPPARAEFIPGGAIRDVLLAEQVEDAPPAPAPASPEPPAGVDTTPIDPPVAPGDPPPDEVVLAEEDPPRPLS